jgi:hypothetical protein
MIEDVRKFFRLHTGSDWDTVQYQIVNTPTPMPTSRVKNGQFIGAIQGNAYEFMMRSPTPPETHQLLICNEPGDINENDMYFGTVLGESGYMYDWLTEAQPNHGGIGIVGRMVARHMWVPERAALCAHELCHALGLPDTWDDDDRLTFGNSLAISLDFVFGRARLDAKQVLQVKSVLNPYVPPVVVAPPPPVVVPPPPPPVYNLMTDLKAYHASMPNGIKYTATYYRKQGVGNAIKYLELLNNL